MEKYLHVTYKWSGDDEEHTILLEGDHRQTNQRIIDRFLERKLGDNYEVSEDSETYGLDEKELTIREIDSVSNTDDLKPSTLTLVVNEHVTDPACRVSYSGPVPGA